MTRSLIEQWFPAAHIGAESLRERATFTALPPVFSLHVWWARRPLITSRAALVASLLPAWPTEEEAAADSSASVVRTALDKEFPSGEKSYHAWFVRCLGIAGDPVAARQSIAAARASGTTTSGNAYGYDRAFTVTPDAATIERFHRLARLQGSESGPPVVLDPFSGGGSIPFESSRYGCETIANELNPVAVAVLNGTVDLPSRLGPDFATTIQVWGSRWAERVKTKLSPYFPIGHADERNAYIWAHTVPCPSTGFDTPLCPSFWLATGKSGRAVAVKLHPDHSTGQIRTSIVEGDEAKLAGDAATFKGGVATSIWDPAVTISTDEISAVARSAGLGELLLAVSVTRPGGKGRQFRAPTDADRQALDQVRASLERSRPTWEVADLVPNEQRFVGPADRSARYGLTTMDRLFSRRQLLTMVTALDELKEIEGIVKESIAPPEARALMLYLALALDKAADYNGMLASWDPTRLKVRNTFDRHDFSFKWTFAELDGAHALLPWAVDQVVKSYRGVAKLAAHPAGLLAKGLTPKTTIVLGSAADLAMPDGSVDAVVTDPPYYDNVMYAECADYFYVWEKRALRDSWPELTAKPLTDKDGEAVANSALFRDLAGKGRGAATATRLADQHYERILLASFREAHRVLKDDGVLTVMFTHKRVDAWDTLGVALLDAGFEILSSWPVHTESEHSLHQAKKNSASSTILLTCRKRWSDEPAYWNDIRAAVERVVEQSAARFVEEGMKGVDLTLATYGPALSVLSRNWPVFTGNVDEDGNPVVIRPDVALDLARGRVAHLKKRELLGGREVEFDRATDWWLLAWSDFQAAQFPAGEALKLCIAMDLDLDEVAKSCKLVKAQSGDVTLLTPAQRRTAGVLDPDESSWHLLVDALHKFMLTYDEDGARAATRWRDDAGLTNDPRFAALIEAAIHAIPRAKSGDEFVRPEARILESIRASLYGDSIPAPAEPELVVAQASLFDED